MGNDMNVRGDSPRFIDRPDQKPTHSGPTKKGLIKGKTVAKNEVNRTNLKGVPEKLKPVQGSRSIGQINNTISKLLVDAREKEHLDLGLKELNSQVHVLSDAVKQMKETTKYFKETKANKKELQTAKDNLSQLEDKLKVFIDKRRRAALDNNFGQNKPVMENSPQEKNVAHKISERTDLKAQSLEIAENVTTKEKEAKQLTVELDEFLEVLQEAAKDPGHRGVFDKIIEHIKSSKEKIDSRYDDKNNSEKHENWMQDMTKLIEDVTKRTEESLDSKKKTNPQFKQEV